MVVAQTLTAPADDRDGRQRQRQNSRKQIRVRLALERTQVSLPRVGLARALCGATSDDQLSITDLSREYPRDTVVNRIWLPTIRAAAELTRGGAKAAIDLLEPVAPYDPAAEFWPQYLRGRA